MLISLAQLQSLIFSVLASKHYPHEEELINKLKEAAHP